MAAAVQSNQPRVSADDANKSCINYRDLCVPQSRTQRRRPDRRIHRSIGRNCSPGFALALGGISEDDRGLQTAFAGTLETLRRNSQGRSIWLCALAALPTSASSRRSSPPASRRPIVSGRRHQLSFAARTYGIHGAGCGRGAAELGRIAAAVPAGLIFRTSPGINGEVSVASRVLAPSFD
jgi:hypothetical protein